jgi:clan AA aspartic protease (TIGR02281 family)
MNRILPRWILPAIIGVSIGWISQPILGPYVSRYIDSLLNKNIDNDVSNGVNSAQGRLKVHPSIEKLRASINHGKYGRVFEIHESIRFGDDDSLISVSEGIILAHVDDIVASKQLQKAAELLKRLLEIDANNIDAQLTLSDIYRLQEKFDAAIKRLYSARSYAHRSRELEKITTNIRSSVEQYDEQLNTAKDDHGLLELYQMLTSIEPDYAPYFMKLAEVQVLTGDYASATQSLNTIIYDPVFGEQAADILQKMGKSEPQNIEKYETVIPLARAGNHYIVEAVVNEAVVLSLLLDTGASLTSIKPQVLADLGIDPGSSKDIRRLSTANGNVDAPVVILPVLAVGEQVIADIEVAVINFTEKPDIDGLLGMNFLQNYTFFVDQSKDVLKLSPQL